MGGLFRCTDRALEFVKNITKDLTGKETMTERYTQQEFAKIGSEMRRIQLYRWRVTLQSNIADERSA